MIIHNLDYEDKSIRLRINRWYVSFSITGTNVMRATRLFFIRLMVKAGTLFLIIDIYSWPIIYGTLMRGRN